MKNKNFYKIRKCRICFNRSLIPVIDLKKQYIQGSFIHKDYPKPFMKKIPLKLVLCKKCLLVQTSHTVNKKLLYSNYWYSSGINHTMKVHLRDLAKEILRFMKNKKDKKILDIGCNDGTLLSSFDKDLKKYGIDPSQIAKSIKNKKLKIFNDFFPPKNSSLKTMRIKFDIITSIAMFYDINYPNDFVKKIKYYLNDKGLWVFELSYLIDMIKQNSFDTICHEHLEYYSVSSINFLLNQNDLKLIKVKRNSINGGSIRCYVTHKKNKSFDNSKNINFIKKLILNEKKLKINSIDFYKKFYARILNIKNKLLTKILSLNKLKRKIYILGASTKGNTILQFIEVDRSHIPYAIERNRNKIGAKTIGSNIKIISENFAKKNPPDYMLVLPWHFKKEIIQREKKYLKNGGKLIFPLPKFEIISYKKSKYEK